MLFLVSSQAQAWMDYILIAIGTATTTEALDQLQQQARQELARMTDEELLDSDESQQCHEQVRLAIDNGHARVAFLARVAAFSEEPHPQLCRCKHERIHTGIFYNSIEAIQCLTCQGWQPIRKVIR